MSLLAAYTMPHPPILIEEVGGEMRREITSTVHGVEEAATELAVMDIDTVVIISPHRRVFGEGPAVMTGERAAGDLAYFRASEARLDLPMDGRLREALIDEYQRLADGQGLPGLVVAPSEGLDHGTLVPLISLARAGFTPDNVVILSIGSSGPSYHALLGRAISAAASTTGRRTVLIASGDLSHRLTPDAPAGYSPSAHLFDEAICSAYQNGDPSAVLHLDARMIDDAGECGLRSLGVVAGAFASGTAEGTQKGPDEGLDEDSREVPDGLASRLISYEGPFGVGYMVASVLPHASASKDSPGPAEFARWVVESYVRTGKIPAHYPEPEPSALSDGAPAGCFVSIKSKGELRGCIGTTGPTQPTLMAEVVQNAISASQRDPRFSPIAPDELCDLSYSVDILGPAEEVASMDDLDPAEYGVIVESGSRRGLLLPDLEGVEKAEQQIDIAMAKAGISSGSPVRLSRFRVHRYKESSKS